MTKKTYIFSSAQVQLLTAMESNAFSSGVDRLSPKSFSLRAHMPPLLEEPTQTFCVAQAVAGLLEYYGEGKTRLSVQFLHASAKKIEREALSRNLTALVAGETLDPAFEQCFHAEILQLRLLADQNGGMASAVMRPFVDQFCRGAWTRFQNASGSLLCSCFKGVETVGICRYQLWPTALMHAPGFWTEAHELTFPPGTVEDAAKRRITSGLYLLSAPNNRAEICGILSGANARRPMPVVVTLEFFDGCDQTTYKLPKWSRVENGQGVSLSPWKGRHALLLVGYEQGNQWPGGGCFFFRNCLGSTWGEEGYGYLPFAYLDLFAVEAGTIRQDLIDFQGDNYGFSPTVSPHTHARQWQVLLCSLILVLICSLGWFMWKSFSRIHQSSQEAEQVVLSTMRYKVFISCEQEEERKALRQALSSEEVPFPVGFMPQKLSGVLALYVALEGDVIDVLGGVLKKTYHGPRTEFWTDLPTLVRIRQVYIVEDKRKDWEE